MTAAPPTAADVEAILRVIVEGIRRLIPTDDEDTLNPLLTPPVSRRNPEKLERLCRYILRPAISNDGLTCLADGRIVLTLKRTWPDGTTHVVFTPEALMLPLAALVHPTKPTSSSEEARRSFSSAPRAARSSARPRLCGPVIRASGSPPNAPDLV